MPPQALAQDVWGRWLIHRFGNEKAMELEPTLEASNRGLLKVINQPIDTANRDPKLVG